MIYILVTYDVNTTTPAGRKRLRHVARCCQNYGQRVQNSVFECLMSEANLAGFKAEISSLIDRENDSIRIYRLGKNYGAKVEHIGAHESYSFEGDLII